MIELGLSLALKQRRGIRMVPTANLTADWQFIQQSDAQIVKDFGPNALDLQRGSAVGADANDFTWNTGYGSFVATQYARRAAHDNALDMGTSNFSIYTLCKVTATNASYVLLGQKGQQTAPGTAGWGLEVVNGELRAVIADGVVSTYANGLAQIYVGFFAADTWVLVGTSWDKAGNVTAYKNGVAGGAPKAITTYGNLNSTLPFAVGINSIAFTAQPLVGSVARALVYKGIAHSAAEQLNIYQAIKQYAQPYGISI